MAYNELNYLQEVKHVQEMAQEKIDVHFYITYMQIWRILRDEKRFFKSYRTFMKYISEPQVNKRIVEMEESNKI